MHIIFDFDGTLVDSRDYIIGIYNSLATDSNKPHITREIFRQLSKVSMRERFKLLNTSILEFSGIYHEIERRYYENADKLNLFKGMAELITDLSKENKLYILSTNTVRIISRVIENNSLSGCFVDLYTNKNLLGKASSLRKIIKANRLDAKKTIYVGDEERDVLASRKAKICSATVAWGYDSRELLESAAPDIIAETPEMLDEFISDLNKNGKA
jgi:phosphoglycolate phosphatase